MKIDASFGKRKEKIAKKTLRDFALPDFVQIPRQVLKNRDLCPSEKLAAAYVLYRDAVGERVNGAKLAEVFGWDPSTGWRVLERLCDAGYLEADNAPGAALRIAAAVSDGFLRVTVQSVRKLGNLEAIVMAQLQTIAQLRTVRRVEKFIELAARLLVVLLGIHADTALDVLKRLCSGLTTRVKRWAKKGVEHVVQPLIELCSRAGRPMLVRVIGERDRERRSEIKRPLTQRPGAPNPSPTLPAVNVPTREEVAAMLRAASRPRPRPS